MKNVKQYIRNIYIDMGIYAVIAFKWCKATKILVILLQITSYPAIRNATALALADLRYQNALPLIIFLISNPKTENYRGTLVHTLQYFDCSNILSFLVDLVIDGNFEVSYEAFQAIEQIDGEIDENSFEECLTKINRAIYLCNSEDKKELLEELKEIFLEN